MPGRVSGMVHFLQYFIPKPSFVCRQIGLAVFILPHLGTQHKQNAKNRENTVGLRWNVEMFTKRR